MIDNLLKMVETDSTALKTKEVMSAFHFLHMYFLEHFQCEEEYQASIEYPDMEEHKKMHRAFEDAISVIENRVYDTAFSPASIRVFIGLLQSWMVNHVLGADQKIRQGGITQEHIDRHTELMLQIDQSLPFKPQG